MRLGGGLEGHSRVLRVLSARQLSGGTGVARLPLRVPPHFNTSFRPSITGFAVILSPLSMVAQLLFLFHISSTAASTIKGHLPDSASRIIIH